MIFEPKKIALILKLKMIYNFPVKRFPKPCKFSFLIEDNFKISIPPYFLCQHRLTLNFIRFNLWLTLRFSIELASKPKRTSPDNQSIQNKERNLCHSRSTHTHIHSRFTTEPEQLLPLPIWTYLICHKSPKLSPQLSFARFYFFFSIFRFHVISLERSRFTFWQPSPSLWGLFLKPPPNSTPLPVDPSSKRKEKQYLSIL